MKKLFHVILISFLSIPLFVSDGKGSTGITAGIEYWGTNINRGEYVFNGNGVFFPFISYNIFDTGLSVTVEGEISDGYISYGSKTCRDDQSTNFCIAYLNKFGLITLGVESVYVRTWENNYSCFENCISFTFEDIFLSPILVFGHDYHLSSDAGTKGKDFYVQFGISHSFDLIEDIIALDLGAIGRYYNVSSWDENLSGISDIDLSVGLSLIHGAVEYSTEFHYIIVPSKDFYYGYKENKDKHRFYASFGASYSF